MRIGRYLSGLSIIAIMAGGSVPSYSQSPETPKDATEATKAANAELLEQLPFDDTSDFDDAKRGLIAPLPSEMIQGHPQQYSFITEGA
jgi:alkyl sulfatase BDS1-like metallo-beta-lactamase superfamily hydrolase